MVVKLVNGNEVTYVDYPGTNNFGDIYAATYGRGIFMNSYFNRVGIDENVFEQANKAIQSVRLYPNPATSGQAISVELEASKNCQATLILYNLSGQMIFNRQAFFQEGNNSLKISTRQLENGTYILQTIIGKEKYSNKFIVN